MKAIHTVERPFRLREGERFDWANIRLRAIKNGDKGRIRATDRYESLEELVAQRLSSQPIVLPEMVQIAGQWEDQEIAPCQLMTTEVDFALFKRIMDGLPIEGRKASWVLNKMSDRFAQKLRVTGVPLSTRQRFIDTLNEEAGRRFRLPHEREVWFAGFQSASVPPPRLHLSGGIWVIDRDGKSYRNLGESHSDGKAWQHNLTITEDDYCGDVGILLAEAA